MGTGAPVLTAVAITQWSCAWSGYLCFSPPLPPRVQLGRKCEAFGCTHDPWTHLLLRDQSEMHATVTEPACHVLHSGNSFWLWYNCFCRCAGLSPLSLTHLTTAAMLLPSTTQHIVFQPAVQRQLSQNELKRS